MGVDSAPGSGTRAQGETRKCLNDAAVTSVLPRYDLERILAPTLVVSAEDDLFGTIDGARYSAGHIPNARFIGYASGGHLLVGQHEALMAAIIAVLQDTMQETEGSQEMARTRWELVPLNRFSIAPSSSTETDAHRTRQ